VIGYIEQMSMPEASTPRPSAVLPFTTRSGSVTGSTGMRYLRSRFAAAHVRPASTRPWFTFTTLGSFLPKVSATWSCAVFASRL
jgi:hypothetical protein